MMGLVVAVVLVLLGIPALLITLHHAYTLVEKRKYPKPGRMVETENGRMHVFFRPGPGPAPGATYVFLDAFGGGSSYFDFKMLWEPLSASGSIATIDYLGYGMSDKTKAARTLDNISGEIRQALHGAGVPAPYIFVAHSLGGFYAQAFAQAYPNEVDRVVFIDNTPPELVLRTTEDFDMYRKMRAKFNFMINTGLVRLSENKGRIPWMTQKEQRAYAFFRRQTKMNSTVVNEIDHAQRNAEQLTGTTIPDSIPTLVLLSSQNEAMSKEKNWEDTWIGFHAKGLNSNKQSRMVTFDTGHYIHRQDPEGLLREITGWIDDTAG